MVVCHQFSYCELLKTVGVLLKVTGVRGKPAVKLVVVKVLICFLFFCICHRCTFFLNFIKNSVCGYCVNHFDIKKMSFHVFHFYSICCAVKIKFIIDLPCLKTCCLSQCTFHFSVLFLQVQYHHCMVQKCCSALVKKVKLSL